MRAILIAVAVMWLALQVPGTEVAGCDTDSDCMERFGGDGSPDVE